MVCRVTIFFNGALSIYCVLLIRIWHQNGIKCPLIRTFHYLRQNHRNHHYSDWTVIRTFSEAARRLKKPTSLQVLGERIRDARKAKKLSQEDLALQADIATSYMGGVERGERNPSFKVMCAVARIVGRDLGSLCRDLPLPHDRAVRGREDPG